VNNAEMEKGEDTRPLPRIIQGKDQLRLGGEAGQLLISVS
jgi:hypothetical protein